jgi:hypothetical protein
MTGSAVFTGAATDVAPAIVVPRPTANETAPDTSAVPTSALVSRPTLIVLR